MRLLKDYSDAALVADCARTNIAKCIQAGIVSGKENKTIAPVDNITRAEVAAIVNRLLQKSSFI